MLLLGGTMDPIHTQKEGLNRESLRNHNVRNLRDNMNKFTKQMRLT